MSERSQGKLRPSYPRSKDLRLVPRTGDDRHRDHGADGRFAPGNGAARDRGWKGAISKLLGHDVANVDDVAKVVAADAWRLFCASLAELPHDGPITRGLAALRARHEALAAFWTARAAAEGLTSADGVSAQEQALKHGMRVERLTVTLLDVATELAKVAEKAHPPSFDFWTEEESDEDEPADSTSMTTSKEEQPDDA